MEGDLPGWTWAPGQWARLPDGRSVLVVEVVDGVPADWTSQDWWPEEGATWPDGAIPDPDGVGMGEWALDQTPWCDVAADGRGWRVVTDDGVGRGPTLFAACEAVARARGGWGR